MNSALRTAATGMAAQQVKSDVIANNLANVNTTAFKRSRAHFTDLLYQSVRDTAVLGSADAATASAVQVGRGTRLSGVERVFAQGNAEQTGRPLDVAIEGEGFLQVKMPDGSAAYTRDGALQISDQGVLVTAGGHAIEPGIKIPDGVSSVTIAPTGIVSAQKGKDLVEIGRIPLSRFTNASGLTAIGENLYAESPASGAAISGNAGDEGFGVFQQGYLESSNVEIVQEMVDMIAAQRAYEINSKAVKAADEMSDVATQLVR